MRIVDVRLRSRASSLEPTQLFFICLVLCDLAALSLFFGVKDEGSWKEIGNSIGKYGMSMAQLLFLPFVFAAASAIFPLETDARRASGSGDKSS